jgi:hypothetical protein
MARSNALKEDKNDNILRSAYSIMVADLDFQVRDLSINELHARKPDTKSGWITILASKYAAFAVSATYSLCVLSMMFLFSRHEQRRKDNSLNDLV